MVGMTLTELQARVETMEANELAQIEELNSFYLMWACRMRYSTPQPSVLESASRCLRLQPPTQPRKADGSNSSAAVARSSS